jgi:UDP-N-acetyl-D-glucosamine dehydrogenase
MKKSYETVAVVGLGYVGYPLMTRLLKKNFKVIGIDIDDIKIKSLSKPESALNFVSIQKSLRSQKLELTTEFANISRAKIVIICVPTPKLDDTNPDLSILENVVLSISPHLKSGTLIINESTSFIGNLRNLIKKQIEEIRPDLVGHLHYGVAPERIDPGNKKFNLKNTPRLVSGVDSESKIRTLNLYSTILPKVVMVDSPEIAEASKLLENTFRLVNISFINEFSQYLRKIDVDPNKVIDAASSKPFGFMRFNYGPGIGGHCIPVDPVYALWGSSLADSPLTLVNKSLEINRSRYKYIATKITSILSDKRTNNSSQLEVTFFGVGYKKDSNDIRESAAEEIARILESQNIVVNYVSNAIENWQGRRKLGDLSAVKTLVLIHNDSDLEEIYIKNFSGVVINCSGENLNFYKGEVFNI